MGALYFESEIDDRWFDLDSYTIVSFHYYFAYNTERRFVFISEEQWPEIRKWILLECEGEVIVKYGLNPYRNWVDLYFEFGSDAMAFKLKWL